MPLSLAFGFASLCLALIVGIPLGILMSRSKGNLADKLGTGFIVLLNAVPMVVFYLFIQIYGSRTTGIPMLFDRDNPLTWILPTICLSLGSIAYYALWLRRFMVDEENRDYVKFAQVKGLPKKVVNRRHVFKNAIIPLAIYLPSDLLFIISGSLVIETLYAIPGTGGLLTTAIKKQDNNLVQVIVLMYAILSVVGVFLGDLLVAFIDPRIKLTEGD
jgi:oligopeptide transport system permease protein